MELVDDSNSNSNPNQFTTPNHTHHLFPQSDGGTGTGRICNWTSSRIVRVSRASGGKDRHSKVVTSKGLRDRRIRLSVSTAIEFYDLQDRLGFDQPSKAVEWLINAAASSIAELPSLDPVFSDRWKKPTEDPNQPQNNSNSNSNNNNATVSKSSACSSTSETSKGSGVSLSRSENRIRARERARKIAAKKEKKKESFTDILTDRMNTVSPMDYNQMQHYNQVGHNLFSFVQENLGPVGAGGGGFGGGGLGSGLGRGTLQSNLLCCLSQNDQYLEKFQPSSMADGSTSGNHQFFAAPASDGFPGSGYDAQCLQLYGGGCGRHSGHYK